MLTYLDGTSDELGYIVGVQLVIVEGAGMALWQDECLGALALVVNVSEMRANIESIDASAAEGNPTAVMAPGMIAFAVT